MSTTITDEGLARLNLRLSEDIGRTPDVDGVVAAARAMQPLSLDSKSARAIVGAEDVVLPGDFPAAVRLARAEMTLKMRDEGMSASGAKEASRRIVGRALLAMEGVTDMKLVAAGLHTSRATLVRDQALVRRVDAGEMLAELEAAA